MEKKREIPNCLKLEDADFLDGKEGGRERDTERP